MKKPSGIPTEVKLTIINISIPDCQVNQLIYINLVTRGEKTYQTRSSVIQYNLFLSRYNGTLFISFKTPSKNQLNTIVNHMQKRKTLTTLYGPVYIIQFRTEDDYQMKWFIYVFAVKIYALHFILL